mmetsp:Transcript_7094/g.17735  ORF Transcript_7094/g.17735 Transcript_7094/m.17735 type:complete len:98 (+) Transcript_7094:211-504(+)
MSCSLLQNNKLVSHHPSQLLQHCTPTSLSPEIKKIWLSDRLTLVFLDPSVQEDLPPNPPQVWSAQQRLLPWHASAPSEGAVRDGTLRGERSAAPLEG